MNNWGEPFLHPNQYVDYENNNQLIAGEYKVIAHFNISNPNQELDINELEAYLIINKITESPQVVDLTTGNLMTMFTYTTQILGSLMMLSMIFIIVIIIFLCHFVVKQVSKY